MKVRFCGDIIDDEGGSVPYDFSCNKFIHGETNAFHSGLNHGVIVGHAWKIQLVRHRIKEYDESSFSGDKPFDFVTHIIQKFFEIGIFRKGHAHSEKSLIDPVSSLDLFGKTRIFNRENNGSRDHVQEVPVRCLKVSSLLVDGTQHADDPVDTLQGDQKEVAGRVSQFFVALAVKIRIVGNIIDDEGFPASDNLSRHQLIRRKSALSHPRLCIGGIVGRSEHVKIVAILVP